MLEQTYGIGLVVESTLDRGAGHVMTIGRDGQPHKRGTPSRKRGVIVAHEWRKGKLYIGVRWESGVESWDAPGHLKVVRS